MTPFARRVLQVVSRIPPGRVATYGDVARIAGKPRASRAVGNLMRAAEMPGLPYHRVIAANGRLGGYGANPQLKAALLGAEGIVVRRGRVLQFRRVRWTAERTAYVRPKAKGRRPKSEEGRQWQEVKGKRPKAKGPRPKAQVRRILSDDRRRPEEPNGTGQRSH